jgi:hypothetical protein
LPVRSTSFGVNLQILKKLVVLGFILGIIGCGSLAVRFAKKKLAGTEPGEYVQAANEYFWQHFHAGDYDSIPIIVDWLNLALAREPNDLRTTAHLGFVHIWALAERQNRHYPDRAIIEQVSLARRYFEEAVTMDDDDPRVLGFLADMTMEEGAHLNNDKEKTEGYFQGLRSIREWPQFNKFTIGFGFARLDTGSANFKEGLKWQYESMTDCACEIKGADGMSDSAKTAIIFESKTPKVKRACADTWIAPHNLEGFFLNMGDMLVKSGQWEKAMQIYALARLAPSYSEWPFRDTLEARILDARQNVAVFNHPVDERNLSRQAVMMNTSGYSCMGCHKMSASELVTFGNEQPPTSYYYFKSNK